MRAAPRGVPPAPRPENGNGGPLIRCWAEGMLGVGWPPRVLRAAMEASGWRPSRSHRIVADAQREMHWIEKLRPQCDTYVLSPTSAASSS